MQSRWNITASVFSIVVFLFLSGQLLPVLALEEDPSIFVIGQGSTPMGGTGWFAGFAIYGSSGTYTLNISATGGETHYPITDVHLIALASDEAASGGLQALSIEGIPIIGFQPGKPAYYQKSGGPFQETDYYGYNDTYTIPQLTFEEANHPDHWKLVTVTIQFSSSATVDSRIAFVCHGTDNNGLAAETPFTEQTLFVIPEFSSIILGLTAMVSAYGIYYMRKRGKPKT